MLHPNLIVLWLYSLLSVEKKRWVVGDRIEGKQVDRERAVPISPLLPFARYLGFVHVLDLVLGPWSRRR